MRASRLGLFVLALITALGGCGDEQTSDELEGVTLALDFAPNAVHAGVYAAVREGEDERRGIKLEIQAPSASTDSLKLLASGAADVAIVDIHDLGLARERGADVVGVGAIVQRPLASVIARGGIERPRELEGERVGVTGLPSDEAVLRAIVEGDGGNYERVRRVTTGFSAVRDIAAGNVDAATAFWNAEGVALDVLGYEANVFRVDEFGAPPYPELVLATQRDVLEQDGELVEAVLGAVAAGTEAALADRQAAVEEIAAVSGADEPLVRAQLDAVALVLTPPVRLDRHALEQWATFDARFGILERPPDVDEAFALELDPDE